MVNKVILIGNVGKSPEIRQLEGGKKVASLSLATTEKYKNKNGEKVEQTEWHNLVFWDQIAGIVEKYIRKGSKIYVEGKLHTRSWEDQNGAKRYTTEIYVSNMQMLSSSVEKEETSDSVDIPDTDDLPF